MSEVTQPNPDELSFKGLYEEAQKVEKLANDNFGSSGVGAYSPKNPSPRTVSGISGSRGDTRRELTSSDYHENNDYASMVQSHMFKMGGDESRGGNRVVRNIPHPDGGDTHYETTEISGDLSLPGEENGKKTVITRRSPKNEGDLYGEEIYRYETTSPKIAQQIEKMTAHMLQSTIENNRAIIEEDIENAA